MCVIHLCIAVSRCPEALYLLDMIIRDVAVQFLGSLVSYLEIRFIHVSEFDETSISRGASSVRTVLAVTLHMPPRRITDNLTVISCYTLFCNIIYAAPEFVDATLTDLRCERHSGILEII